MSARIGFARESARKLIKNTGQSTIPIDLQKICEELGFQYVEIATFPPGLSALCVEQEGVKYAVVNKGHHSPRKRFSLAHELGHWIFGHTRSFPQSEVTIDHPPNPEDVKRNNKEEEAEANEFAGELLVPLSLLKESLKKTQDIAQLASMYDVSKEVMTIRRMSTHTL